MPASAAPEGLAAGMVVQLQNGMKVDAQLTLYCLDSPSELLSLTRAFLCVRGKARVTRVTDEVFTIDANDELAGKDFKVSRAMPLDSCELILLSFY